MSTRKFAAVAAAATPPPAHAMRADAGLRRRAMVFLLLFPLLVLLYPLLQTYRIHETDRQVRSDVAYVAAVARGETNGLLAPYGFGRLPTHQARADAVSQRLAQRQAMAASLEARRLLAWISLATATAALLLGLGVLLSVERNRRQALASRHFLLEHFAAGWQRTSRRLLLQAALMLLTLLCNVAFEGLWSYEHWHSHGLIAAAMTLPLWGAIAALAGVLVRTLRATAAPGPLRLQATARPVTRAQAPRLWDWLEHLARPIQAPLPDHLVIGLDEGFYVTEAELELLPAGQRLRGRTLHVPLALASVLSERETRFIIGHELGHFTHADTGHGQQLALVHRAMQARIDQLAAQLEHNDAWLAQAPLWTSLYVLSSFDHAYAYWSREQELAADRLGAAASDARAGALALLRSTALQPALALATGTPGGNVVARLQGLLRSTPPSLQRDQLDHALPHPIDSHPPTRMRVDALGVPLDQALLALALRTPDCHDQQWLAGLLEAAPATT